MREKLGDWFFYVLSVVSLFIFVVASDYTVYSVCKDILKLKVTEILIAIIVFTMFIIWFLFRGLSAFNRSQKISERS